MMRSLWTGAAGMNSQQLNVDVISNNIANVNTTGYKKERAEFETLMYQTISEATKDVDSGINIPNTMQVGHGVRPVAISRVFDTGSFERTENSFDFAIEGKGFFTAQRGDEVLYTRDGSFKISLDGDIKTLVSTGGYLILDSDGDPVEFEGDGDLIVDESGNLSMSSPNGSIDLGIQLGIVQFQNPQGLATVGRNFYTETVASGEPLSETEGDVEELSSVVQGVLEMSNVQIADEMVKLIIAQRAYELNSKTITTSDEMLQQANNLKN